MSSTPSFLTSIVCKLERLRVALFSDEESSGHIRNCPDCQTEFRSRQAWEQALRKGATQVQSAVPPMLEQRILHAVRRDARHAEPPVASGRNRLVLWGPAFVSLGIAAFLVLSTIRTPESPLSVETAKQETMEQGQSAQAAAVNQIGMDLRALRLLAPKAGDILDGTPLEDEARAVVADVRDALHFVAMNFLPVAPESLSLKVY